MKQLKRLNLIIGLGATCLLISNITGVFSFSTMPVEPQSPAVIILLATALLNLMSACVYERDGARRGLQVLGSLLLTASAITSGIFFYNTTSSQSLFAASSSLFSTSLILLSIGTLLQLSAVLDTVLSSTTPKAAYLNDQFDDNDRETGSVKWFNVTKGFGFITRDEGDDVFVHYRAIRGEGHRTLSEGQRVEFILVEKDKGFQAEDVTATH